MKKLLYLMTALLILVSVPKTQAYQHDVMARYMNTNISNTATVLLENGKYVTNAFNGITITVVPEEADENIILVIHKVESNEKDAYEWFENCSKTAGDDRMYFNIYFADKSGKRLYIEKTAKVEISFSKSFERIKVYELSTSGELSEKSSESRSSSVVFTIQWAGYFVISTRFQSKPSIPAKTGSVSITATSMLILATGTAVLIFKRISADKQIKGEKT